MEKIVNIENINDLGNVFGNNDENISIVEDAFNVRVSVNRENLVVSSENEKDCFNAQSVLERII